MEERQEKSREARMVIGKKLKVRGEREVEKRVEKEELQTQKGRNRRK